MTTEELEVAIRDIIRDIYCKEYVSKLGYNPIEVKRDLDRVSGNNKNRYTGVVNKDNIYNSTKISFKSREVSDEDETPLMLVQPVRSNQE